MTTLTQTNTWPPGRAGERQRARAAERRGTIKSGKKNIVRDYSRMTTGHSGAENTSRKASVHYFLPTEHYFVPTEHYWRPTKHYFAVYGV